MNYLVSYRPLVQSKDGKRAIHKYGFPPYVDDSCRREPDFEAHFPSITAICRGTQFAPRLQESDLVVYITRKDNYRPGPGFRHWRLTAVLKILKRFESHVEAAQWYQRQGVKIPRNCIVEGNPPLSLEYTGNPHKCSNVEIWDADYCNRVGRIGVFLACKTIFLKLNDPPILTDEMMYDTFGRIPGTRNPPAISDCEFQKLIQRVGISI